MQTRVIDILGRVPGGTNYSIALGLLLLQLYYLDLDLYSI